MACSECRAFSADDLVLYALTGTDYGPTNAMIALAAPHTALTDAQTSLDDVQAAVAPWKLKVTRGAKTSTRASGR